MKPPMEIQITRGASPENKPGNPSLAAIDLNTEVMLLSAYLPPLMSRICLVLATSKGLVQTAAVVPAKEPHKAACQGVNSLPKR